MSEIRNERGNAVSQAYLQRLLEHGSRRQGRVHECEPVGRDWFGNGGTSSGQGVTGLSFINVDVTADAVGNIRDLAQVIGSGQNGTGRAGGFRLVVVGNTDLKGAVISSGQEAIDAGKNSSKCKE